MVPFDIFENNWLAVPTQSDSPLKNLDLRHSNWLVMGTGAGRSCSSPVRRHECLLRESEPNTHKVPGRQREHPGFSFWKGHPGILDLGIHELPCIKLKLPTLFKLPPLFKVRWVVLLPASNWFLSKKTWRVKKKIWVSENLGYGGRREESCHVES